MIRSFALRLFTLLLLLTGTAAFAVENSNPCAVTPIKEDPKRVNIFTPDQEVYLGEILADWRSGDGQIVDDAALNAYLTRIGQRLVKKLPPTNLEFRFYVSDSPEANGYSIAGGRVYITRKLVAFARTEDEIAGVIAHELGHIVTHQQAVTFSKVFKDKLGVTSFADRKDLMEKFHQMLESKKSSTVYAEDEQGEADRVGLDILVRAGYDPEQLTAFWDRFTANKGKTGSWLTDMFGNTDSNSKRYREMLKERTKLPTECIDKRDPQSEQQFKKWQAAVIAYDRYKRTESLPGLVSKKSLEPPLQDQFHTLRFSPDGKYVLAQDNGTIYVLTREPFQLKFSVPAENAFPARFTPDSKLLSFYTPDLRAEVWDLASGEPQDIYDLHSAYGCMQSALSADAKTLACLDVKDTLVLIDTTTQDRVFEKKHVRSGDVAIGANWGSFSYELDFVNLAFSPDSKYLLLCGRNATLALDVTARKEVPLAGNIKSILRYAFTFLDNNRILGLQDKAGAQALIVSFPDGNVLDSLEFGTAIPSGVTKGNYVLMRPIRDYEVGVLDLKSKQIVRANKKPAMDIWGDLALSEMGNGEIGIFAAAAQPVARVTLPRARFAGIRASAVSDDFQWLAVAEEERGAIWNLSSGQRLYNLKTFKGAYFDSDGAYVDFPKQDKMDRSIAKLSLQQPGMTLAGKLGSEKYQHAGPYLLSWIKNSQDDAKEDAKGMDRFNRYRYEGETIHIEDIWGELPEQHEKLEVRDSRTGNLLWARDFDKNVPKPFANSDAGVIGFIWRVGESGGKGEFDKIPGLANRKSEAKFNDYLVEVADLKTGSPIGGLLLPLTMECWFPRAFWLLGRGWPSGIRSGACLPTI